MNFNTNVKKHAWTIVMQTGNMIKAGWTKEEYSNPEWLANAISQLWEESGSNRQCGVAVCRSAEGLYHAHIGAYSKNATTLKNVSKIFFDSHVEPQLGNKEELTTYLKKEGKYAEKGETVLFTLNLENIQCEQGHRSDLDAIDEMIKAGMTPNEIMNTDIHFRTHEKIIKSAFYAKRFKEVPVKRNVNVIWHTGESGTGKSYTYVQLTQQYGEEQVYLMNDYKIGGFDNYMGEPILFMDEFKGDLSYQNLLGYLEGYKSQIHCRYANAYALWTEVHITSIFAPEEVYSLMVETANRRRDCVEQLMRRINTVVYHFVENGEYKTFSLPASEYKNLNDLKQRATTSADKFVQVTINDLVPFDQQNQDTP